MERGADTDDLLVQALEPGEKIVWSDRPHALASAALHMLWRRLTRWSTLVALVFLGGVVFVFVRVRESIADGTLAQGSWEAVGVPLVLGVAALPILFEAYWFLTRLAHTPAHRYAVTDKGRGLIVLPDLTGSFSLPSAEKITTAAMGDAEHGDIDLGICEVTERADGKARRGPRRVVFRAVSYPLVAVETIRSACGRVA